MLKSEYGVVRDAAWEFISPHGNDTEWLARQLAEYWPDWMDYLAGWWSQHYDVARLLSYWSPTRKQAEKLAKALIWRMSRAGSSSYLSEIKAYGKKSKLKPGDQIMLLLEMLNDLEHLDLIIKPDSALDEVKIGGWGKSYLYHPEDYEYNRHNTSAINEAVWQKFFNKFNLFDAIRPLIWVLYWSNTKPTPERVQAFLDDMLSLGQINAIPEGFWLYLRRCQWRLLGLAVRLQQVNGRAAIEKLIPYLNETAHLELIEEVRAAIHSYLMQQNQSGCEAMSGVLETESGELTLDVEFADLTPDEKLWLSVRAGIGLDELLSSYLPQAEAMGISVDDLIDISMDEFSRSSSPKLPTRPDKDIKTTQYKASHFVYLLTLAAKEVEHIEKLPRLISFLAEMAWPPEDESVIAAATHFLDLAIVNARDIPDAAFGLDYPTLLLTVFSRICRSSSSESGLQFVSIYGAKLLKAISDFSDYDLSWRTLSQIIKIPFECLSELKRLVNDPDPKIRNSTATLWRRVVEGLLYEHLPLLDNYSLLGTAEDAMSGVNLIIDNSTNDLLRRAGVCFLIGAECPINDEVFRAYLEHALEQITQYGDRVEDKNWQRFFQSIKFTRDNWQKWQLVFRKVLSHSQKYGIGTPKTVMERFQELEEFSKTINSNLVVSI